MKLPILMVCVSTQQNTTNVLPAINLDVKSILIVETSKAHNEKWSDGMIKVLKKRGFDVLSPILLTKEQDSRIDLIQKKLENELPKSYEIIWNLGGGQKAQQLALWQTFIFRKVAEKDEIACYANPDNHHLEMWEYNTNNRQMEFTYSELNSNLSLYEIFCIYGYQADVHESDRIFPQNINDNKSLLDKLMEFEQFREYFFKIPTISYGNPDNQYKFSRDDFSDIIKKQNKELTKVIETWIDLKISNRETLSIQEFKNLSLGIKNLIRDFISDIFNKEMKYNSIAINMNLQLLLHEITNKEIKYLEYSNDFVKDVFQAKKISFFFEKIIVDRLQKLLINYKHNIFEAYQNINIYKDNKIVGEHDVILVTKWGTIISIDAKTYDLEQKEYDARLLNLREGAGRYVKYIPVFPFFVEDMEKDYFPTKLKDLLLKLSENRIKFYTYNYYENNLTVTYQNKEIEINPIEQLLTTVF